MPNIEEISPLKKAFLVILNGRVGGAFIQKIGGSLLRHLPGQITCQQFSDFLHGYVDGKLSVKQRSLFERHMKICPMCRVSLASYLKAIEMGQAVISEDQKKDIFTEAPQELIDAIIKVYKASSQDDGDSSMG